eukprot:6303924-Pyramimonas_sp.AAC.1
MPCSSVFWASETAWEARKSSRNHPKELPGSPREPHDGTKGFQDGLREPHDGPRWPQDTLRSIPNRDPV